MSVSRRVLGLCACVWLALGACKEKEKAPFTAFAPPPSGLPPLGEEAPAAPANDHASATHPPMHAAAPTGMPAMPPGHPSIAPGAGAAGSGNDEQATPGDIPFDPKAVVAGVLRLDDKVKTKVAEGDVIFLVARGADVSGAPGPVLAVKKMNATRWPLPFQLDARDAMMSGTKLHGKVIVTARVDKDGDAMSKNPGDVTGSSRAVEVPSSKVVVTLDTVL